DERLVVFFDIDNTLYSASSKIAHAMGVRIHAYFLTLGLDDDEASELHLKYYTQYGLALRGLTRHHNVDPLDFDEKCDGSLPLEDMLTPDPKLRELFQDIDRTKCRVWALTNAYKTHASRVLKILNLDDQVDGLIYCDYQVPDFVCKPEPEYYLQAMKKAGVSDPAKCLFVDDNLGNVEGARRVGWERVIGDEHTEAQNGAFDGAVPVVRNLQDLRKLWPDIFRS
ncbi:pyrimidine 5-nucleotidase, partial [Artomyces pyxidatus]